MDDVIIRNKEREFRLRATLGKNCRQEEFVAWTDTDAIGVGAMIVMRNAHPNVEPWASGHIELINDMDVIIAEMGAKE
jgi:hypothetical protein